MKVSSSMMRTSVAMSVASSRPASSTQNAEFLDVHAENIPPRPHAAAVAGHPPRRRRNRALSSLADCRSIRNSRTRRRDGGLIWRVGAHALPKALQSGLEKRAISRVVHQKYNAVQVYAVHQPADLENASLIFGRKAAQIHQYCVARRGQSRHRHLPSVVMAEELVDAVSTIRVDGLVDDCDPSLQGPACL